MGNQKIIPLNLKALGAKQVNKYWIFLLAAGLKDDINQEIAIAAWLYPNDLRSFGAALNRGLYQIATRTKFVICGSCGNKVVDISNQDGTPRSIEAEEETLP